MAKKKGPSGGVVLFAILVMAGLFVAMLFVLEILPIRPARLPIRSVTPSATMPTKATEQLPIIPIELILTKTHTNTPSPSKTPTPTATLTNTPMPTPTSTEKPMPYIVRGTPVGYQSKLFRTESKCDTFYVAGNVVDLQESPVYRITIKLGGTYGGDIVDFSTESGETRLYGDSGFEFAFVNKQIVEDQVYIQLFSNEGEAISSRTYLNISNSCDQNLLNVTFKQVR